MARKKSLDDINTQNKRLYNQLREQQSRAFWSGDFATANRLAKRMDRVSNAYEKYVTNITPTKSSINLEKKMDREIDKIRGDETDSLKKWRELRDMRLTRKYSMRTYMGLSNG